MAREANPPIVPPRPDRPRTRPRSPPPPPPLSPPTPPDKVSVEHPLEVTQSAYSPPTVYSQQSSAAVTPNPRVLQGRETTSLDTRKPSVRFLNGEDGQPESMLLEANPPSPPPPPPKEKYTATKKHQKIDRKPIPRPEQIPKYKETGGEAGGNQRSRFSEAPEKSIKNAREPPQPALEFQYLLQVDREAPPARQQDAYRAYTRSAEARVLCAEAKDHYGKAKNHLQEALRLSADILRLTPHVLAENINNRIDNDHRARDGTFTGSNNAVQTGPPFMPKYPGIGLQYRSLFTPLLSTGPASKGQKQATEKRRTADSLARDRAAVARHAAGTSVTNGSVSSKGTDTMSRSKSKPEAGRTVHQSGSQGMKKRPASSVGGVPAASRPVVRMRDGSERRVRARTRSAAGSRMRKRVKEEAPDHGLLWFFSY